MKKICTVNCGGFASAMEKKGELKMKIKWKVSEKPSGNFASFELRQWPEAEFENGSPAAEIRCLDEYVPELARIGKHLELKVIVACWGINEDGIETFKWKTLKQPARTLKEAKELVNLFFYNHPKFIPKE